MFLVYAFIFSVGAIFGSFFLVVGERTCNNESIIKPASHCDYCKNLLRWYELIPVLSYLILGGKCGHCRKKIPIKNLIIEIFTGVLFLLSFLMYNYSVKSLIILISFSLLIIIFITDFKYLVILDTPLYLCTLLILGLNFIDIGTKSGVIHIFSSLIIFLIILGIKFFGDKLFAKESLGGGDVKLGFFIGALLGIKFGLISLMISSLIALPFALIYSYIHKEKEVPFGPFLIAGAILVYIYLPEISNMIDLLLYI